MNTPPRPRQHPVTIEKIARRMAAWRFGHDTLPDDIAPFLIAQPEGRGVTVVSPNTGHSNIARHGDWIIQTEVGCLYVVDDGSFRRKYRELDEQPRWVLENRRILAGVARRQCERMNGAEP